MRRPYSKGIEKRGRYLYNKNRINGGMGMHFYIASALKNAKQVSLYAEKLKACGWHLTYDWTKDIDDEITPKRLAAYAAAEQKALVDSDLVVVVLPAGRGAHVELGMALALHKRIFLCATNETDFQLENTVAFYEMPGIVKLCGTIDENVAAIQNYPF